MVEVLLIYIASVLISFITDKINYYQALYEINKQGTYVIPAMFRVAYKKTYETKLIEKFIPIYNIAKPMIMSVMIPKTMDRIYDILNDANVLELMEPEKKEELDKTPTFLKAKELTDEHEQEINNYSKILFNDDSIIYFDANDTSISRIKRTIGPISHQDGFTKYERLNKAIELYKVYLEVTNQNNLSEEDINQMIKSQFLFNIRHIDENIDPEAFREEIIEALKYFEAYLESQKSTKIKKRTLKK